MCEAWAKRRSAMRPASFEWFVLISAGILLIALSKRLAQMYLIGYEKTAKWLFGPLSSALLNGVYVLTDRVDRLVNDPHQAITARTVGQLYNSCSGLGLPNGNTRAARAAYVG